MVDKFPGRPELAAQDRIVRLAANLQRQLTRREKVLITEELKQADTVHTGAAMTRGVIERRDGLGVLYHDPRRLFEVMSFFEHRPTSLKLFDAYCHLGYLAYTYLAHEAAHIEVNGQAYFVAKPGRQRKGLFVASEGLRDISALDVVHQHDTRGLFVRAAEKAIGTLAATRRLHEDAVVLDQPARDLAVLDAMDNYGQRVQEFAHNMFIVMNADHSDATAAIMDAHVSRAVEGMPTVSNQDP